MNPANLPALEDTDLTDGFESPWLVALRSEGVFFSAPLDLDFSMLSSFPAAYQHARPEGIGPRTTAASIQEKKRTTLKTGGNPDLFGDSYDPEFTWYPYLFLSNSKPKTHLEAMGRIGVAELAADAPQELTALIEYVKNGLGL